MTTFSSFTFLIASGYLTPAPGVRTICNLWEILVFTANMSRL